MRKVKIVGFLLISKYIFIIVEKLKIEKIEEKKNIELKNKPVKDALTLNSENILKAFQIKGKISNNKIDDSDFDSLEESGIKPEIKKNNEEKKEEQENLNKMIFNIAENLGQESSHLNPLITDLSSVKTKSIQEEKLISDKEEECHFENKRKMERYFDDVSSVKCFKCGELGHTRNTCLDNSKVRKFNQRSAIFAWEITKEEIVQLKFALIVVNQDI